MKFIETEYKAQIQENYNVGERLNVKVEMIGWTDGTITEISKTGLTIDSLCDEISYDQINALD